MQVSGGINLALLSTRTISSGRQLQNFTNLLYIVEVVFNQKMRKVLIDKSTIVTESRNRAFNRSCPANGATGHMCIQNGQEK